jgi:hypothetical protein
MILSLYSSGSTKCIFAFVYVSILPLPVFHTDAVVLFTYNFDANRSLKKLLVAPESNKIQMFSCLLPLLVCKIPKAIGCCCSKLFCVDECFVRPTRADRIVRIE